MTLEESKEVIPMMEAMITQIEEQQNIMAEMLQEIQENGDTCKYGNSYLLWGLDKGSIANQSAISLIIRATGICWNQVVCKGMAGKQRLCLKIKKLSETQRSK